MSTPRSLDVIFLAELRDWSQATFGPGQRTSGIVGHIAKELDEITQDPGDVTEWIDVVGMALDGAMRAGHSPQDVIDAMLAKHVVNAGREWPNWRDMEPDAVIEHVRGTAPVTIGTDGSCKPNPGPGGWAWAGDDGTWAAAAFPAGTNNLAELMALDDALRSHPDVPLTIVYDSKYAQQSVTTWGPQWVATGQTGRANYAIIVSIIDHLAQRPAHAGITWEWIRGHTGHRLNEKADELAGKMTVAQTVGRQTGRW